MYRLPRFSKSGGAPRPRVLIVDDHRGVRDRVSALLDEDFAVAGVAADGREALEVARRIDPDLIVLDVNMPGLDGFETRRALDKAGSRAPVVFVSMADTQEYVAEALRCGGRGFVVKSRLATDLPDAIDQVLRGRLFVPSLAALHALGGGGGHGLHLHRGLDRFLDSLSAFVDLALRRGDAMCVIATEDIRHGLAHRLRAEGWPVDGPSSEPRYLALDADAAIRRFMRNGLPDPAVLAEMAAELDDYRGGAGPSSRLTIFGNMAGRLIASGNTAAAMALEHEWNRLTEGLPVFTLCGYSVSSFHESEPGLWPHACDEHGVVSHGSDL